MEEIELKIVSVNVDVGARKINATYTREMANDLAAYHGIVQMKEERRIKRIKSINKIFNN